MTKARLDGLCLLLLGSAIFVLAGSAMERMTSGSMEDFKAVYYGSRCLLQHCDPYSESDLLRVYLAEGGERPSDALQRGQRQGITVCVYPPAAFIFIAPFALLPWGPAHALWMILIAGSFILAAFLMWNTGASHAPVISGGLIALLLVNSMSLLMIGNAAGVVVSLCAVAVWCFIEERFAAAGVLCLAACLAIKPHDAGLVWLYFLLAGGVYRKRALQTLAVTAALAIPAVVWVGQVAPHWMRELNSNLATLSAPGGLNSPDPTTASTGTAAMVVNLQSVVSVFRDDPRIYNSVSYLVCGALLLNTAGFVLTGDIPLALLVSLTRSLHVDTAGLPGKMLTVVLARPAPLMLLAMSVFYLIALQRLGVGQGRNSAARRPTDKRRP